MYTETSDLLAYTPEQISLLVDAVQMKIKDEQATLSVRQMMAGGEDMSELIVEINNEGIKKAYNNLEDLYGLRVALLNVWAVVKKMQQIECN